MSEYGRRHPMNEKEPPKGKTGNRFAAVLFGMTVGVGGVVGYNEVTDKNIWDAFDADHASAIPSVPRPTEVPSVLPTLNMSPTPKPTKTPRMSPTPSVTSPSSPASKSTPVGVFMPHRNANGTVSGASATYRGYTPEQVRMMENCGNNTDRVLLTIDDFGTPAHIRAMADVLKREHVGAAFFPNTKQVSTDAIEDLRDNGFWVGNHSYSHPNMAPMKPEQIKAEIEKGTDADLFRPPYGATYKDKKDGVIYFDNDVEVAATKLGKRVCMWSVDTRDWDHQTAQQITDSVKTHVRAGSTILIHMRDEYKTLDALPGMIKSVRERGLEFCALPSEPTTSEIPESLPCDK